MKKQNEAAELLNDQIGGKLKGENYELIEREDYNLFTIVTTEKGSFVALGQHRLTDFFSSDECKQLIDGKDWLLLVSVILLFTLNQK